MKKLFAILIGLMGTLAAWAQTSIRVEVHNIVELSERFNLVFVVEGEQAPSDFQWTAGEDVTVVWGPQKGSSRNVQIVNGKTTRSSQTFYTYILQARKTGTLTIPSAVAKVKGEELRSKPAVSSRPDRPRPIREIFSCGCPSAVLPWWWESPSPPPSKYTTEPIW